MNIIFERTHFSEKNTPKWPCPSCEIGLLLQVPKKFEYHSDAATCNAKNEEYSEPEMYSYVFSDTLKCFNCSEIVVVTGIGHSEQQWDDDEQTSSSYHEVFSPKFFQPSPPIIKFPVHADLPDPVVRLLIKSFKLFWCDYDACANRLRASLEALLDGMSIARKKNPDAKRELSLHDRIGLITAEKGTPMDDVKELIMAVKWLGNAGSHELKGINRSELIDGYKMIELCLNRIFPEQNLEEAIIVAKARKINTSNRS